ncbi:hypothetical protein Goshw_019244, partial [Gossypium schwendimanii]|nr:hypothetical protein [Gossypium schwendimanii]
VFGWTNWFSESIFLDRNWAKDESKLKSSFEALSDYPMPFWMTIFVEGTRLTADKLLEAQSFASSKGYPIPKNVLIPKTKIHRVGAPRPPRKCEHSVLMGFEPMPIYGISDHETKSENKSSTNTPSTIPPSLRGWLTPDEQHLESFS